MTKKGGAGFLGTFWLVLGGCGSAVLAAAFADVGIGLLGVSENTFVFFTSDNGPQMDSWPDSGCTPFRGGKAWAWEGGVRVPGIAYWKGMIKPRESAGLFDLMDLFNTSVHLAAADEMIPADRYIDGIDQTSFLIAGNGKTKREQDYVWVQTSLAAMRMREHRVHVALTRKHSTFMGIDYATAGKVGLAPWLFNLCIDPKEQMPVGHRMNPWLASMGAEAKAHAETFKKYPPKDIGLKQQERSWVFTPWGTAPAQSARTAGWPALVALSFPGIPPDRSSVSPIGIQPECPADAGVRSPGDRV